VDISDASEIAFEQTMKLNDKYGQNVDARDVQRAINLFWNFIAIWPDDLKKETIEAYVFATYCRLSKQPIEGCEPPMDEEEAERAFREALTAAGVDPYKYRNYQAVWSRVWDHTKNLGANAQRAIFSYFAQYQYRRNPSVRGSPSQPSAPTPSPAQKRAQPLQLGPQSQPQPQEPPQGPALSEDEKRAIALAMLLNATRNMIPEAKAVNAFNQEWDDMKHLPLEDIARVIGGLINDLIRESSPPPENAKAVVRPPPPKPSAGPGPASSTATVSAPASPDVSAAEFLTLEYGMRQANPPLDVLVDLKRKLAALLHQFSEEKLAVKQGRAPSMPVGHVLVEALLYDYGDQLVENGWGPIISGSEAYVIRDLWEQLGMFGNFNKKYDYKQDKLVQVNIEGVERDIPAWQVVVYATLALLLKYLNIPDKYGWEYFDDVLIQMGQ